jgi:hypothetical protein
MLFIRNLVTYGFGGHPYGAIIVLKCLGTSSSLAIDCRILKFSIITCPFKQHAKHMKTIGNILYVMITDEPL